MPPDLTIASPDITREYVQFADLLIKIAALAVTIVGVYFGFRAYNANKRVAKAKFISELNNHIGSSQNSIAIKMLEDYRDALLSVVGNPDQTKTTSALIYEGDSNPRVKLERLPFALKEPSMELDKNWNDIRNVVRFYESIMFMIETGALSEDDVFPLMGYRIALVLNCPMVQKRLLFSYDPKSGKIRAKYSFLAVFALYDRLFKFYELKFGKEEFRMNVNLLLQDFKYNPLYDLRHSAHLLWRGFMAGNSDVFGEALETYERYKIKYKKIGIRDKRKFMRKNDI